MPRPRKQPIQPNDEIQVIVPGSMALKLQKEAIRRGIALPSGKVPNHAAAARVIIQEYFDNQNGTSLDDEVKAIKGN